MTCKGRYWLWKEGAKNKSSSSSHDVSAELSVYLVIGKHATPWRDTVMVQTRTLPVHERLNTTDVNDFKRNRVSIDYNFV